MRHGDIAAQLWSGDAAVKVTNGLIHDWIGAVSFGHNLLLPPVFAWSRIYDNHNECTSDVMDSKLISHHGDDFQIFLRLLKKKIITCK